MTTKTPNNLTPPTEVFIRDYDTGVTARCEPNLITFADYGDKGLFTITPEMLGQIHDGALQLKRGLAPLSVSDVTYLLQTLQSDYQLGAERDGYIDVPPALQLSEMKADADGGIVLWVHETGTTNVYEVRNRAQYGLVMDQVRSNRKEVPIHKLLNLR